MKVIELREKYGFRCTYAKDDYFFKHNQEAEVLSWATLICTSDNGTRAYAYGCVFRSARLLVGFINGRRVDPQKAYHWCKNIRLEQYEHPSAVKEVFMEAV